MRLKMTLAATALAASAVSASAGGLLNAEETVAPTAPVVLTDAPRGSLDGALIPLLLVGGLAALALNSGGGS